MLKRIFLFGLTNIAVLAVIVTILNVFGVQPYLTQYGINYQALLIFSLVLGFGGAFVSLFLSKWMAKMSFHLKLIDRPSNDMESFLVNTISRLAQQMKIGMPDVGIYDSPEPNAFATGWNRNNALVAVSTGLLHSMDREAVEGVLGHELSHIANGDMVTLTLIQGVVNTFVFFLARVAAFAVTQAMSRDDHRQTSNFTYYMVAMLFQVLFGILASMIVMWFSRYREFRADAGSANNVGKAKMVKALRALQSRFDMEHQDNRAPAFAAMKISGGSRWGALFSSHPPLEKRIAALEQQR
jgi:heat shock protein HtpX